MGKASRAKRRVVTIDVRSEALLKWCRRAPPHDQAQAVALHRHLEDQYRGSLAAAPLVEPAGVALGLHELVDEAVADTMARDPHARDVKCRRGCCACCYQHVVVTQPEARLAAMAADEAGWVIDTERARRQAAAATSDDWRDLPPEARACVFLNAAGECAIYEHRPMACRKYLVVSDPADCDTFGKPGHGVLQLVAVRAEVAFSAALGVFPAGTLAAMVLAAGASISTESKQEPP